MRALASLIAVAAVLAGCAGDDERLSRDEFVEQATTICSGAEKRVAALEEPGDLEALEAYAREARGITEAGVSDLRELEPPEELEGAFGRYLERGDEVVALLGELEDAAAANDEAAARRVSGEIAETADAAATAAREAGIPACEEAGT